jgi:uncharacterized protein (TIGR02646 family)
MIKIKEKSLVVADIPTSLQLPMGNVGGKREQGKRETTHEYRLKIITNKKYPTTGNEKENANSRYKQKDVKSALELRYHHKCAYCEQKVESYDVEHYRPKKIYYWLAYSWDNLLFCCEKCNQKKSAHFDTLKTKAIYKSEDLPRIHELCQEYNQIEQPLLLHPEYDNAEPLLVFNERGEVSSTDTRAAYTISADKGCDLSRKYLCDDRKEILDEFRNKLDDIITTKQGERQKEAVDDLLKNFAKKAFDEKATFLAFRRYVLIHIIPLMLK